MEKVKWRWDYGVIVVDDKTDFVVVRIEEVE